jgi:hypothetical protein
MERKKFVPLISGLLAIAVLATACAPVPATAQVPILPATQPPPVEMYSYPGSQNPLPVYALNGAAFNPACETIVGKESDQWENLQKACDAVDTLIEIFKPSVQTQTMLRNLPERSYFVDPGDMQTVCPGYSGCTVSPTGNFMPFIMVDRTLNNIGSLDKTLAHEDEHGVEQQGRADFTLPFADGTCMTMKDEFLYSIDAAGNTTILSGEITATMAEAIYMQHTRGGMLPQSLGYLAGGDPAVRQTFYDFATYGYTHSTPGMNTIIEPITDAQSLTAFLEYMGTVAGEMSYADPNLSLVENGRKVYELWNGFFPHQTTPTHLTAPVGCEVLP